ncbi:MAG: Bifunctional glutamine synthetase adenylyltransferase/adenylyl-removing enzyme [Paracidovorax wautersii]|uniref:Bifunctional glutamine synthetase adenylyltransferase/adenylyl-removing enzyme n=1 Tax=Paracidovorax wautersii TaxID=1177982 RepID=A0A7V8JQ53_9BURK|nr:MAG: Bifunctional glutamine synthetase adenylyltransferase/adenylyl-removing enzyme [Paracidovorax wautersii]
MSTDSTLDRSPPPPAPLTSTDADAGAAAHSRLVQRLRRRYTNELPLLPAGAPVRPTMQAAYDTLRARGYDCASALRVMRQLVIERLAVLDCEQQAPLAVVTQAMTELAEVALEIAHGHVMQELSARHGAPLGPEGQAAQLWVVGMGKLGARELNVSSDIDLIYIYDHGGDTAGDTRGGQRISNHEFFGKAVKAIYALIGDVTEHGFVFRVDLALRPHGNSGPPAISLDALEDYFLILGREWERFAWLKSRVVAPHSSKADGSVLALRGVVLPFVFRRYLDYRVFDALRDLHRQIREQAVRRCAGHPERANDVKLSRGGIREIEFTVQLLQVVRGGQFPELRTRSTLDALPRLAHAGLMPAESATMLAQAYVFLRQVEHRIQYLDDQQTHTLPTADEDLAWIARTLGFADACALLERFYEYREQVAGEFDKLLGGPKAAGGCNSGQCNKKGKPEPPTLDDMLPQLPERFRTQLEAWRRDGRIQSLRDDVRLRRLIQRTAHWLQQGTVSEDAALRFGHWLETLLRRDSYLALLLERPTVHERLLRVLGAAQWPARYLMQHPGVIDELASTSLYEERFGRAAFDQELERRRAALASTGEDDEENLLNLLRRAHHAETFRTLARDVEGKLTVEQVSDDLSALAEAILDVTLRWSWRFLRKRHRDAPQFAVIAYGKLGGKELGYGSDLDIVFVYDDDHDDAPEVYANFVRKLITWLTIKTGEGDLFEIDTALRPNGNSGLLATRFEAYANYQQQRGSNTAWTWEHQAITRARMILDDPTTLRARFDAVREAVITAPRDRAALRAEIIAMRERVRAAYAVRAGRFDLKYSPGGMVDAEFVVQFLVLADAAQHPELVPNVGNIALLQRAEAAGLLPAQVGQQAAAAYRTLRRLQHKARLDEAPTQVEPETVSTERDAILALWHAVFGDAGKTGEAAAAGPG